MASPSPGLRSLGVAVVLLVIYTVLAMWILPVDTFFMGDQGPKFLAIQSWVQSGFGDGSIPYPGSALDPEGRFAPTRRRFLFPAFQHRGGETYAKWSELIILPNAVLYSWFGYRGLYLLSLGPITIVALLCVTMSRHLRLPWPELAGLTTGVATPLLFYAVEFWEHALAVLWATAGLAVFSVALLKDKTAGCALSISGLLLGLAPAFRPELYFLPIALGIAAVVLWRDVRRVWRWLSWIVVGFVASSAASYLFNFWRTGSLDTVALMEANLFRPYDRATVLRLFLMPAGMRKWCAVVAAALLVAVLQRRGSLGRPWQSPWFVPAVIVAGAVVIVVVHLVDGFVPFISVSDPFPLAFFAVVGLVGPRGKERRDTVLHLLGLTAALYLLLTACFARHWGGSGWGPRYALVVYPVLVLWVWYALGRLLSSTSKDGLRSVLLLGFALLLVLSLVIQGAGIRKLFVFKQGFRAAADVALELDPAIVATPIRWYAEVMAPIYQRLVIFGVVSTGEVAALADQLSRQGIDRFWWATMADPELHLDDVRDPEMLEPLLGSELVEQEKVSVPLGEGQIEYVLLTISRNGYNARWQCNE